MKRFLTGVLAALLVAILLAPPPAAAQYGFEIVQDPWNLVKNAAELEKTIEQLRRMEQNLEKITNRQYRDLLDQLDALLKTSRRGTVSWTTPGVANRFAEFYGILALSPEIQELVDARGVQQERAGAALSTLAASIGSVATHADDYEATLAHLQDLKANAGSARGNLQALEVAAMYQDAIANELVMLNQALGALVSGQNAAYGYELAERASFEATINLGVERFLELEIPVYDDTGGQDGIPDDWPYPCFGCN